MCSAPGLAPCFPCPDLTSRPLHLHIAPLAPCLRPGSRTLRSAFGVRMPRCAPALRPASYTLRFAPCIDTPRHAPRPTPDVPSPAAVPRRAASLCAPQCLAPSLSFCSHLNLLHAICIDSHRVFPRCGVLGVTLSRSFVPPLQLGGPALGRLCRPVAPAPAHATMLRVPS